LCRGSLDLIQTVLTLFVKCSALLANARLGLRALAVVFCTSIASPTLAAEGRPIAYFSGFAFAVRNDNMQQTLPRLSALLSGESSARLDRALGQRAAASKDLPGLDLRVNELGTILPGDGAGANVLALAFDRETIAVTKFGDNYKLLVELSFSALIFNYSSKSIVANYPMVAQYIDVLSDQPSTEDISNALDRVVFGEQATGVQATFWEALYEVRLPEAAVRTLRVTDVGVMDSASAYLAGIGAPKDEVLKSDIGQSFSKYLVANNGLSVLPTGSNTALGNKMAAKMSNGDVYDLNIPEADYQISITLNGVKKVETARTAAGASWVYGAFVTISVVEPLSGKSYFNDQMKLGASRTVPASVQSDEDWPSYSEVIQQLFFEFTRAIAQSDAAWAKRHIISVSANTTSPLQPLRELLDKCR